MFLGIVLDRTALVWGEGALYVPLLKEEGVTLTRPPARAGGEWEGTAGERRKRGRKRDYAGYD